ncbi:hypothetical protein TTHERM_00395890 (macronuclear) [Tetrahymena thermophila SB210]|uniref:Uncharacterized protein n=1 Tax=Tetrahymena thermophila (strain SB210) TaxID=312017 RepID=Q232W4_TETTS|nr:hypothetical protein TTHERM_00395890 [Tetrahymena thermophila SB210]EAR91716.2 hypothetical protein TTHERM_00395890 [Tetrahymena thermophila SB210]|eukprot:XP_001011961.2 hypothetical protein TTHERM_00395890 [Tetrahymena thermophila SB210]
MSTVNKKSIEWFNLPAQLYKYANCLSEYIKRKEYNNEDDFMTFQMLYFKLMDIYKYFDENKVLNNFIPEEELLAVFKRKLIRYRMHFLDLYNEFSSMLDQIVMYKKKKKMLSSINLSTIRETHTLSESSLRPLQESPNSKKEQSAAQSIQKKSIKTVLLLLTSQFKENIKKIKPIYEEIVKLTPPLTQNLHNQVQKMSLSKQNSSHQNENPKSSFASQQSNPSFNSSNFSLQSSKSQESIENIMKTLLSLAQSIKLQIREIENQTQNLSEFQEHQAKFKNSKVAFFNCIGAIEIYWMLRFDNVSDFLKTQIKQLQKGMEMFLEKLKKNAKKNETSQIISATENQKKDSQDLIKFHVQQPEISRNPSMNQSNLQENLSEGYSSHSSQELYYTAKSNQLPRYKISEQIALEEIPEEDQGKTSITNDNNFYCYQSQQSELESKDENDIQNNTLSQSYNNNEKFSLNSNFQFILKQGESSDNLFKSILSNSDINKESQIKINQNDIEYRIEQTISLNITSRESKEQNKTNTQSNQDRRQNAQQIQVNQADSQKTSSTKSQANPSNPSGMSEMMTQNQTWMNDKQRQSKKQPDDKLISIGYCLCISKIS